ncbi:ribose-5-phosphate isomerase B [Pedobacter sp. BAL39]|nr:ribose-5-phosphate isomerase B [Pedobacter sp. BAL39]
MFVFKLMLCPGIARILAKLGNNLSININKKLMKVILGSDHAGYRYKQMFSELLTTEGYEVLDLGAFNEEASDYPDHAEDVAVALQEGKGDRGILVCGSAVGVSIAANKFKGIRAGVCHDTYSAHQAVEHDDVNVLCLGERVVGPALAKEIVLSFLKASFTNETRHVKRLAKITAIEDQW